MKVGTTTYQPRIRFRVLMTDWEAEGYTECWTENPESAQTIAAALKAGGGDVTVQIDKVIEPAPEKKEPS